MTEATTLLREYDFREANIPEKMLVIKIDQSVIDKGMSDAAERFLTIAPADDGIQAGDIVRVSFPDEAAEDGMRQAQFSVGRYFFDRSLENAILGMLRGQTAELNVKGRTKPVTIISVKRRHIPPLTDAAIAGMGIEGVSSVSSYRQYLVDKAVQRKRYERDRILTEFVEKQVIANSEFATVDHTSDEYRSYYESQLGQAKKYAAQEEGATEAGILRMMLGLKEGASDEETCAALVNTCEQQAKLLALGRANAQRDGVAYTVADCEADLRKFAAMRGMPYEDLLEDYTPESLLPGKYIQYYEHKILTCYERQYTVSVG